MPLASHRLQSGNCSSNYMCKALGKLELFHCPCFSNAKLQRALLAFLLNRSWLSITHTQKEWRFSTKRPGLNSHRKSKTFKPETLKVNWWKRKTTVQLHMFQDRFLISKPRTKGQAEKAAGILHCCLAITKENNAKRPDWFHPTARIVMEMPPREFGPSLWSNLRLARKDNTHHLLLMFSWDLLSDVEELAPLESGGLMSSTWGREGWEGEKPLCGEDGVRTTEPGRLLPSVSVTELLLPCRVGVPVHRTESPPSLASCFRLRYSSRDTCERKIQPWVRECNGLG